MKRIVSSWLFALVVWCCACAAQAVAPSAIQGSYYDPQHSGHGFSVEALADGRAIAYWYVYDGAGNPVHLYIEGPLTEDTYTGALRLTGRAYLPRGMRFGAFDPASLSLTPWGDVSLFLYCDSGSVIYDGNGPAGSGFGQGAFDLRRLAAVGDVIQPSDCAIRHAQSFEPTVLAGAATGDEFGADVVAAVDEDGRLWVTGNGQFAAVITATLSPFSLISLPASASLLRNTGLTVVDPMSARVAFEVNVGSTVGPNTGRRELRSVHADLVDADSRRPALPRLARQLDIDPDPQATAGLHRPFDLGAIAGFQFESANGQQSVQVDAQGAICWRRGAQRGTTCDLRGMLTPVPGDWAFFDFQLTYVGGDDYPPVKGRGWVIHNPDGSPRRLVLVGQEGGDGAGFFGDSAGR